MWLDDLEIISHLKFYSVLYRQHLIVLAGGCDGNNFTLLLMLIALFNCEQDVLKEKQQHIEQLLKERDLERAEITKAASQVEEYEQKLATLKREFDRVRVVCENALKSYFAFF